MTEPSQEPGPSPPAVELPAASRVELSQAKRALIERRLAARSAAPGQPIAQTKTEQLSLAQEQLWYFHVLDPENPVYNEAVSIDKTGPFDHSAFVGAFNDIVARHEAWHTTFEVGDGQPVRRIVEPPRFDLPVHDLSALGYARAEAEARELFAAEARRPYDLSAAPPIRPTLVRLTESHHRLCLALHHLVFDGFSLHRIILPDLVASYEARLAGVEPTLSPVVADYGDFVAWERGLVEGPEGHRRLEYWRHHLAGLPTTTLPLDHPRPPVPRFRGRMEPLYLSPSVGDKLHRLAVDLGVTLFQLLATIFSVLLHKYSFDDEVVFGVSADFRQRRELQSTVGFCVAPLVLRCRVDPSRSVAELAVGVRSELIDALDNAVPFAPLVKAVRPERRLGTNPLFQAMLGLETRMDSPDSAWSMHLAECEIVEHAKFDLSLGLDERPDGHFEGMLILNSDVFDASSAPRIAAHFGQLVDQVVDGAGLTVSALSIVSPAELGLQLDDWNATDAPVSFGSVPELVEWRAECSPNAVAFECEADATTLTYSEWLRAGRSLASRLHEAGVGRGAVVGLYSDRGCSLPIGVLGIQLAGAAYLALEPSLPAARLAFMIEDSGASAIVVASGLQTSSRFEALSNELARSEAVSSQNRAGVVVVALAGEVVPSETDAADLPAGRLGSDVAYVMYTSGSTGRPKGVEVTQAAVANLLASLARLGLDEAGTLAAVTSFGFDTSVVDLFMPSLSGARAVIAAEETIVDPWRLAALMDRCAATFMQATPTAWRLLMRSGWEGSERLVAVSTGEPLDSALAVELLERTFELWNGYGPTETTVWASLGRVTAGEPVNIGRPVHNTRLYVLDPVRNPVPIGVTGELWIGGSGLAKGYVNRPDETTSSFVADPFRPAGRMYRTGDRVRYLPDGRLEHLGRADDQIKLRGHRIELGEVESCLSAHPGVHAAAVVLAGAGEGGPALVAFVVLSAASPREQDLRDFLRQRLPGYMMPSAFVVRTALPTNANGKLDRPGLVALAETEVLTQFRAAESIAGFSLSGRGASGFPEDEGRPAPAPTGRAAPSTTALEDELIGIWRELLSTPGLTVDDDFFEIGGHSLLAVMMVDEVRRRLGVDIPVSALYERGATVRGMARTIDAGRSSRIDADAEDGASPGGRLADLHFVVPTDTALVGLRHLASSVGRYVNVKGVAAGRQGELFDRTKTIEDRAEELVESLVAVPMATTFYLAGLSLGGLIAYEAAAQLRRRGCQIAWLGLVNTPYPPKAARKWASVTSTARAVLRGPGAMARAVRRQLDKLGGPSLSQTGEFDGDGARAIALSYAPPEIDVRVDLFISESDAISYGRWLGWPTGHGADIGRHPVPGEHRAFRDPLSAQALGEAMAATLDVLR